MAITHPGSKRLALIVSEDPREVERIRKMLLNEWNHCYYIASAGSLAGAMKTLADERRFDVVLVNWLLPGGASLQLIEHLAADSQLVKIPVIVFNCDFSVQQNLSYDSSDARFVEYLSAEEAASPSLPKIVRSLVEQRRLVLELSSQQRAVKDAQRIALEAKMAKNAFLTGLSHELRTPLTAIVGLADVLRERPCSKEVKEMLDMIRYNGQHLTSVLGSLLDLAEIDGGRAEIRKETFSVATKMRELERSLQAQAAEAGVDLRLHVDKATPTVINTDPERMREIVRNLTLVAIRYSEETCVDIEVRPATDSQDQIEMEIRSGGDAISDRVKQSLYSKRGSAQDSLGCSLSLSISLAIARALGGNLEYAEEGRTSCKSSFILSLPVGETAPLAPQEEACPRQRAVEEWSVPRKGSWTSRRILIAEDTPTNQYLLQRLLEPLGAHLVMAQDGEEAIAAVNEASESFDLILMDMHMPNVDGYHATRQLRQQGYIGTIVAITAAAMAGDAEKCFEAGCDAYLTKPFQRRELLSRLDELMTRRGTAEQPLPVTTRKQ